MHMQSCMVSNWKDRLWLGWWAREQGGNKQRGVAFCCSSSSETWKPFFHHPLPGRPHVQSSSRHRHPPPLSPVCLLWGLGLTTVTAALCVLLAIPSPWRWRGRAHTVPVDQCCRLLQFCFCMPRFLQDFLVNKRKKNRGRLGSFWVIGLPMPGGQICAMFLHYYCFSLTIDMFRFPVHFFPKDAIQLIDCAD